MRCAHAIHISNYKYSQAIVVYSRMWLWHYRSQEFEQLSLVGWCEIQLVMYLLDLCVSYSTYLVTFKVRNGSREALSFP